MRALSQKTWHQWALLAMAVITLILALTPDPADSMDPVTKLKLKKMKMKKVLGWMAAAKGWKGGWGGGWGWKGALAAGLAGGLGAGAVGGGLAGAAGGKLAGGALAGKSLWGTLAHMNDQKAKIKARQGGYGWGGSSGGGGGGGWGGGGSKEESIVHHSMDMARQMFRVKKGLLGAKSEILKAQGHMMVSTGVLLSQLLHSAESSGLFTYLTGGGWGGGGGGGGGHGHGHGHEHIEHEPLHHHHSSPHQHTLAQYVASASPYDGHHLGWPAAKEGEAYNSEEFQDLRLAQYPSFRPFNLEGGRKHSQEGLEEQQHDFNAVHVVD